MKRFTAFAFSLTTIIASAQGASADPLVLGYLSRPGFAEMVDGKPSGAFLPIAAAAVAKSGLQVEWVALPQKRLIDQVRQDMPNYCATGIYETAERQAFATFSGAFYRDQKLLVATVPAKEAGIKSHPTLLALTQDSQFKLGAIDGFSYGTVVDAEMRTMTSNLDRAVVTPDKLLAKLAADRIDYTLSSPEELDHITKLAGIKPDDLVKVAFSDMPLGATRHFMCSKSISDATLTKLNAGIVALDIKP